jgi:hypothetical protein
MRTEGRQPDLIRNSPPELARAYRLAAETARRDPHFAPHDAEQRARFYEREAERLEKRA